MSERSVIATLEAALTAAAPEKRSAALDHVVDLFVAGAHRYTDAQIALFDKVFLKLAQDIEVKARRRLGRRLAPIARAPKATIAHLAHDRLAIVAAPVLSQSPQLDEAELAAIARTGGDGHRYALSRRAALNEAVTNILADFGGRRVARSLARNPGARLSDAAFGTLVRRAAGDDILARAVGARPDIPKHRFVELLMTASSSVRVMLAATAPFAAREIEEAVADALVGVGRDAGVVASDPALAKAEVHRLGHGDRRGDVNTLAAARARKFDQAATALSLVCRVPRAVAERALVEDKADMLLILAKAAGCAWKTTKALLRIRAGERPLGSEDLAQARADFARLQRATARAVLARYRQRDPGAGSPPTLPRLDARTDEEPLDLVTLPC